MALFEQVDFDSRSTHSQYHLTMIQVLIGRRMSELGHLQVNQWRKCLLRKGGVRKMLQQIIIQPSGKNKQTNVSKSWWKMKLLKSSNKLGSTAKQWRKAILMRVCRFLPSVPSFFFSIIRALPSHECGFMFISNVNLDLKLLHVCKWLLQFLFYNLKYCKSSNDHTDDLSY